MKKIKHIFSDGSSSGNPGPGGYGAVIVVESSQDKEIIEIGGGDEMTTNNRMEMTAVIKSLKMQEDDSSNISEYHIYTDSRYVLDGATKWMQGWKNNGWMTSQKKSVLNQDLWAEMSEAIFGKRIEWHLLKGHIGVPGNERADKIAVAFSKKTNPDLYTGTIDGYSISSILDFEQTNSELVSKKKSKSGKAFSYVSKVGGVISIDSNWDDCKRRVNGARGALYRKSLSKDDEKKIVAEFAEKNTY